MSAALKSRYASLLLWIAYVVVPTGAGGLIHGVPLGPIDAVALLMIAWLLAAGRRVPGGAIVAAVMGVSLLIAAAIPGTGGFRARYFASATPSGAHERSTEYPDRPFTRIDDRLIFAPGGPEFPLAFFNDPSRFNFYQPQQPHRRRLEFAATWSGFWWVTDAAQSIYIEAPGASAQVSVDGVLAAAATPGAPLATADLALGLGWHRLDVSFSSPYAGPRQFSAGTIVAGERQPFDAGNVATRQSPGWQMTVTHGLRAAKTIVDAVALGWLAWLMAAGIRATVAALGRPASPPMRRRLVLLLLAIPAAAEAVRFAWPWSSQTMLLTGGDDPMTYEWYARDILLNGLLMNGNLPLGEGEPFYYQAFYPYFLAAVHAVFGEGMFGVMLIQRLLVVFSVWALVEIAVAIAGDEVWPSALGCATVFAVWKYWPIASELLNESLYVAALIGWTGALLHACRARSTGSAVGAGLLGGVTAITRSTVLLAWPAVFAMCWWEWRRSSNRRSLVAALLLCSLAVFSLIAVRNWIVAGEFAATSTELGVTLLGGNEPPPGLMIDLTARGPLYERLGMNEFTAQVVEYAITAPGAFIANLARKAVFVLGFYEPYAPGWGYSPIYIAGWMLAAAGVVLAIRAARVPPVQLWIPAVIALSQFAAIVVVYPKGERLILPIHALLVPYAAIAVARLIRLGRAQ